MFQCSVPHYDFVTISNPHSTFGSSGDQDLSFLGIIPSAYSSYVFVVLVGFERTADARSVYRCNGFRVALFPAMFVSASLVIGHVDGLVGIEELVHISL